MSGASRHSPRLAEGDEPGAHPRHVAVMIGAEHVDEALEAALALGEVIGDVGGEIGLLPVLAHHHAVLLVAELGGAEPQRAVAALQASLRLEQRERVIDRAALGERALGGPVIEAHAELG